MSYCVNCGVELEETANKCPLCSTPVINPNTASVSDAAPSYSDKAVEIPESVKKRFAAFIMTIVMLIPNIVCFLVNILFHYGYTWVWLLNATSILIWTYIVLPLMCSKKTGVFYVLIDTVAAIGYAYVINYLEKGTGWFAECAVPIIIILAALLCFSVEFFRRKKPGWILISIIVAAEVIIASIPCEIIIVHFINNTYTPSVSLIISACCIAVIGFFIAVARNRKMKAWLEKKFFVD